MKRWLQFLCVFAVLDAVVFLGCSTENTSQALATVTDGRVEESNSEFELIRKTAWDESNICSIETSLTNARTLLKDLPPDKPKNILEIKELGSHTTLLRQTGSETALSLELVGSPVEGGRIMISSYSAGSAEVLKIFLVSCDKAKEVFSASYRDFYSYAQFFSGNKSRFVLFTADNLTESDNKLMVTRWEWNGHSFADKGKIPYDDFITNLTKKPQSITQSK